MNKVKIRIVVCIMIVAIIPSLVFMGQSGGIQSFQQMRRDSRSGFTASEDFSYAMEEKLKDFCEYVRLKELVETNGKYDENSTFITFLTTLQRFSENLNVSEKKIAKLDAYSKKNYSLESLLQRENGKIYREEFQKFFDGNLDVFSKRKNMSEVPYQKGFQTLNYGENNLYFYNNTLYKLDNSSLKEDSVVVKRNAENLLRRVLLLEEDKNKTDQDRFDYNYITDEMGQYQNVGGDVVYSLEAAVRYAAYVQAAYEYYDAVFSKDNTNLYYYICSSTGELLDSNCDNVTIDEYFKNGSSEKKDFSYFSYESRATERFWLNYKGLFSGLSEEDMQQYQQEGRGRIIVSGDFDTSIMDNFGNFLYSAYKRQDKNLSNIYVILAVDNSYSGKDLLGSANEVWQEKVGTWQNVILFWCITGVVELFCMLYLLFKLKKTGWKPKWFLEIYFLLAVLFLGGFAGIIYQVMNQQNIALIALSIYGIGGSILFATGAMQLIYLLVSIWMPASERKSLLQSLFRKLRKAFKGWVQYTKEIIKNFRYYYVEEQKEAEKLIQSICIDAIGIIGILVAYFVPASSMQFYSYPYNMIFCISVGILLVNCGFRWRKQGNRIRSYEKILIGSREIAEGDFDYKISTENEHGEYRKVIDNLNRIADGISYAVDEKMKSERMKTDLIANVSHDIKTPLTSIINYVGLLKTCEQNNPSWKEYVEVLDNKSQRLKTLIEDLIEASKVSSGTLQLEKTNMNINELIAQTNGEFIEKLEEKNLTLQAKIPEEPVVIYADGMRVFRILENLYNNVTKYSMPGTRVYAQLEEKDTGVYFILRNISQEELNITPDELTERFIRGDASRTTEGSGLGLSIAKSLMELHGGTLEIYLEGDLFRVTLCFPKV